MFHIFIIRFPQTLWPSNKLLFLLLLSFLSQKKTRLFLSTDQQRGGSYPNVAEHTSCNILSTTLSLKLSSTYAPDRHPKLTEGGEMINHGKTGSPEHTPLQINHTVSHFRPRMGSGLVHLSSVYENAGTQSTRAQW